MDTSNIKKYAPKARVAFQQAVKAKANSLGISESNIEVATQSGDFLMVADRTFPATIKNGRDLLVREVELKGFEYVIEHVASTWFNRFCAIRFIELKGYLEHGYRVLSHPTEANSFEILSYAADVADDFSLDRKELLDLSLAGNKEEEIYRQLILGQCHILHQAMEFLFEKIDGACELLLPDGLTRTDSIIRDLVNDIPEGDWQNVEIIGWLYQSYISEKKDEVIGKVVKSEDIPAATQLFTPNWIVQYLVQNSVGRQWLQTYPESPIKAEMPYYIEPAKQSDEVNKQLAEITPSSLDPETIKVLDPACGSGHILVEAYKTLKAIYTDRGYKPRDIPKLILEKNLYGFDIDDRAAQLAGFALMMMARADDRRIFTRGVKLNVLSLQETTNLDIDSLWQQLGLNSQSEIGSNDDLFAEDQNDNSQEDPNYKLLVKCKEWFLQAKTLGSLIDVPESYHNDLQKFYLILSDLGKNNTNIQKTIIKIISPIVHQALLLSQQYEAVVANPPYMGGKYLNTELRDFAFSNFFDYKADLYSVFCIRAFQLTKTDAYMALVTPFTWLNLQSYKKMRGLFLENSAIQSIVVPEYHSFFESAYVPLCATSIKKTVIKYVSKHIDLSEFYGADIQPIKLIEGVRNRSEYVKEISNELFEKVHEKVITTKLDPNNLEILANKSKLNEQFDFKQGLITGENEKFLRFWFEVDFKTISSSTTNEKWFYYHKGGAKRKWYGNLEYVVNWKNDGFEIRNFKTEAGKLRSRPQNIQYYQKEGASWTSLTIGGFSLRYVPEGHMFDQKGPMVFVKGQKSIHALLAYLNSKYADMFLKVLAPTLDYSQGPVGNVPDMCIQSEELEQFVISAINIAKNDWDKKEFSNDFLGMKLGEQNISAYVDSLRKQNKDNVSELLKIENSIHSLLGNYFKEKNSQVKFEVTEEEITLFSNLTNVNKSEVEIQSVFLSIMTTELISYSIGCMMGRYSLDREGLVYAHSANKGFDDLVTDNAYQSFPADDDGIVPLTDMEWFPDDATYRFRDFVKAVWGEEQLQENLDFVAESLCLHALKPKRGESSIVTIRRYMSYQFFKDHLKTYKKRPIYWLFSSGKQKAFECLVYLHRYNEGTLARMRTQYVTPLIGKYQARIGQLEQKLENASTSEKTKLSKDITLLEKKLVELRAFDDNLKHYADMRISIDLDDGVKVNYGKFGNLLAEVKAIHGQAVK
jgi:type II restriction/modification system DNA methylase subunit YeeA